MEPRKLALSAATNYLASCPLRAQVALDLFGDRALPDGSSDWLTIVGVGVGILFERLDVTGDLVVLRDRGRYRSLEAVGG